MISTPLAFHAVRRPQSTALIHNGASVTYRQLESDLQKLAGALRELGIGPRDKVALACSDLFTFFLFVLALDRLACVIVPFAASRHPENLSFLSKIDWALADFALRPGDVPHQHRITSAWLQQVLAEGAPSDARVEECGPDDPVQIISTSGTTGAAKHVVLTRRMMQNRFAERIWQYGLSRHSRNLIAMPFTVGSVYSTALTCIYLGATVVFETRAVVEVGTLSGVTHVIVLPMHLRQLLDAMPAKFPKPPNLTVVSLGAPLPRALFEATLERLATDVIDGYGTNEVGQIASMEPPGKGLVLPGVEVQIVNESGQPVPLGTPGRIGVQTPGMANGYMDDATATKRMFHDGWFYPGDVGILRDRRQLEVLGRDDEIINIGGQKVAPLELEELVARHTRARDVGVCTVANAAGEEQLMIALAGFVGSHAQLLEQVRGAIGEAFGPFLLVTLTHIPRNELGKVQRSVLRTEVGRALEAARRVPA
jgi:acyl-coenzyme A synthetase/AMP-(fatty) acid ligase